MGAPASEVVEADWVGTAALVCPPGGAPSSVPPVLPALPRPAWETQSSSVIFPPRSSRYANARPPLASIVSSLALS